MGIKVTKEGKSRIHSKRGENCPENIMQLAAGIYLFLMLGIYPLFLVNGYEDLVYKKWALFLYASSAFTGISILCGIGSLGLRGLKGRKRGQGWKQSRLPITVTDGFVLTYLLCVFISYVGAVDKQIGMWGVDTWYMGLISQILFAGMYFGISRGYAGNKYIRTTAAIVGVIVGSIVILQRFDVDVLNLYAGYDEEVKRNFVTTLGQVTWSSTYISILLIAGMGIYYMSVKRKEKLFWGSCIGVGFASEMLLNCDSGMIALFAAWMIMLWSAFGNRGRMLAFLETVGIALTAAAGIGILERIFAQRMIPIDAVYLKAAQSPAVYVLLAAVSVLYLLMRSNRIKIEAKRRTMIFLKGCYIALVIAGIIGVIVLFILHEKNYFNGSPTENYFRFTIWWGNSRGFIWRTAAAVFADFNIGRKLFGCGPDCFTPYAYALMGDAINEFWHNQLVPNAHNEWFNAVINYGLAGGAAYLGIFLSAARDFMGYAADDTDRSLTEEERAVLFGTGLAAAGYIAHNVLCYQQIIGTPLIFALLGAGAAIKNRNQKQNV